MFQGIYDDMVKFASEGELAEELPTARQEYLSRTGELFETDETYESRIATFLEWYVLDRTIPRFSNKTPARLHIDAIRPGLTTPEVNRLRGLLRTNLSLFEFKKAKEDGLHVVDLLDGTKHEIFERRRPAGLEPGDIIEARLVPFDDRTYFSETFTFHPRQAHKQIRAAAKTFRKKAAPEGRVDLVHRVAYLTNRCHRYKHVDPRKIFAELAV